MRYEKPRHQNMARGSVVWRGEVGLVRLGLGREVGLANTKRGDGDAKLRSLVFKAERCG